MLNDNIKIIPPQVAVALWRARGTVIWGGKDAASSCPNVWAIKCSSVDPPSHQIGGWLSFPSKTSPTRGQWIFLSSSTHGILLLFFQIPNPWKLWWQTNLPAWLQWYLSSTLILLLPSSIVCSLPHGDFSLHLSPVHLCREQTISSISDSDKGTDPKPNMSSY